MFRFIFLHWHFSGRIPRHPVFFSPIDGNNYRFFPVWEIASPPVCEVGMKGDYPGFKVTYTDEELTEHFLLTSAERALVETCRGDVNRPA